MTRWEYRVTGGMEMSGGTDYQTEAALNEFRAKGWELVAAVQPVSPSTHMGLRLYWKRRVE